MADSEKNEKYTVEDGPQAIIEPKAEDGIANEISELSKKGYSLLKENRTEEAKEAFKQILSIEDNNNYALVGLGDCERKKGKINTAVEYYTKCLACHPGNNYALFGLADCYRGLNQQFRSIEYWNKILEQDPKNKVILTRAGDAYRNMGDYDTATEYYNRAMDIDFDIYAALGLALICKGKGKYDEAIDHLQKLIRDDDKNYRLYIDLADCYLRKNDKKSATEVLQSFQKKGVKSQAVNDMLEKLVADKPVF